MPSFAFLSTIALALLSVTPALAGAPLDASADLVKRQQQTRGRPNHALEYGYPFRRGDHSGTRSPPPTENKPMTPGGYVDPRPPNEGLECRNHNQCSTAVKNARAVCVENKCSFQCLGRTVLENGACTGQIVSNRCSFDRQCPTNVANATGKCQAGHCTFACNAGSYAFGSTCKDSDKTCGNETCPDVVGGYSICENGKCSSKCEGHLGFRMYCNADKSVCQCTNTQHDVNNCGAPGNVCPPSYNGKGRAYCAQGQCGLSCHRLLKVAPREGPAYCV